MRFIVIWVYFCVFFVVFSQYEIITKKMFTDKQCSEAASPSQVIINGSIGEIGTEHFIPFPHLDCFKKEITKNLLPSDFNVDSDYYYYFHLGFSPKKYYTDLGISYNVSLISPCLSPPRYTISMSENELLIYTYFTNNESKCGVNYFIGHDPYIQNETIPPWFLLYKGEPLPHQVLYADVCYSDPTEGNSYKFEKGSFFSFKNIEESYSEFAVIRNQMLNAILAMVGTVSAVLGVIFGCCCVVSLIKCQNYYLRDFFNACKYNFLYRRKKKRASYRKNADSLARITLSNYKEKNISEKKQRFLRFHNVWNLIKSIIFIAVLQFKEFIALYFTMMIFFDAEDFPIIKNTFFRTWGLTSFLKSYLVVFTNVLLITLGVFTFLDCFFLLLWINNRIFSPFQVAILYGAWREFLLGRVIMIFCYTISLVIGLFGSTILIVAFLLVTVIPTFFGDLDEEVQIFNTASRLDFPGDYLFFYQVAYAFIFLVYSILQFLNYNGSSCYKYYIELKNLSATDKLYFPNLSIGLRHVLLETPDEIISDTTTCLSLIENKEEYEKTRLLSKFAHMKWEYIKDLNDDELKIVKLFLLEVDQTEKLSPIDIFFFTRITSLRWIQNFFFGCFMKRKVVLKGKSTDVELEDQQISVEDEELLKE